MRIYRNTAGNTQKGQKTLPSGNYTLDGDPIAGTITVTNVSTGIDEIQRVLFSRIFDADGNGFSDYQSCYDYLQSQLNFSSGGGSVFSIREDRFFDTEAERDAAIPSPTEGEYVALLVTGETFYRIQRYESGSWVDRIEIARGPKGDTGDPTALIDDDIPSDSKTYSSEKIEEEVTALTQLIDGLNPNEGDSYIFIEEGNDQPTDNGNWKIEIIDGLLTFERRESGNWIQKGVFGNSLITDEIFLQATFARISVMDNENTANLIRQTQSLEGTDVGDLERETFISSEETVRQAKFREEVMANPLQPVGDETFTGDVLDFVVANQNFGKLKSVTFNCDAPNGRLQLKVYRDSARTQLAHFSTQDEDFVNGAGLVLAAGENILDLRSRPLFFSTVSNSYVRITALSGTGEDAVPGELSIEGSTIGGQFIPQMTTRIVLADIDNFATETFVTDAISGITGEHPVTLRRDMPSQADSLALTQASLNDNSALWVISANQLANSNRDTATLIALSAGQLDADGNPIPMTPTDASTIRLRGGTVVRIFGQDDFRVVTSPVLESDITNGGQPNQTQARFTRFEFQSQPTSVSPGTSISGLKTFLINIERPDLLTGHLTILQGDTVLTENTLVPTVRSAGVPINAATLTNAGDTVTFTIRATTTEGAVINSRIVVRAYEPHELAYWGIRPTNDFATILLTGLTNVDVTANSQFTVSGDVDENDYIGILVPTSHDIRSITLFNLPALDSFTRTENAREINGVQYHLYTKQSQAQFTTEVNAIINV